MVYPCAAAKTLRLGSSKELPGVQGFGPREGVSRELPTVQGFGSRDGVSVRGGEEFEAREQHARVGRVQPPDGVVDEHDPCRVFASSASNLGGEERC